MGQLQHMNKKFLLIGLGALLLLAGGGGGAYYVFFMGGDGAEIAADGATEEYIVPTKEEMIEKPEWKRMPELLGPVHHQGLVHHYAYIAVVLLLADGESPDAFEANIPYVHDAFVREIHGAPITQTVDSMEIDTALLGERLRRRANESIGREAVITVEVRGIRHASPI